ncbi:hypothetical protein B6257_02745 [Bacillus velezensis]|nr:hypothetical protein B6257_02745 [Bacillus velezensis]
MSGIMQQLSAAGGQATEMPAAFRSGAFVSSSSAACAGIFRVLVYPRSNPTIITFFFLISASNHAN